MRPTLGPATASAEVPVVVGSVVPKLTLEPLEPEQPVVVRQGVSSISSGLRSTAGRAASRTPWRFPTFLARADTKSVRRVAPDAGWDYCLQSPMKSIPSNGSCRWHAGPPDTERRMRQPCRTAPSLGSCHQSHSWERPGRFPTWARRRQSRAGLALLPAVTRKTRFASPNSLPATTLSSTAGCTRTLGRTAPGPGGACT